jgi:hypothetical protein
MSSECFDGFLDQITTRKIKGTVILPLVAMFGGSVPCAQIVLMGSKLRPEKKGTVIWPLVGMSTTYF